MKAPRLGSIEESQQKKGDDQERDTIGEVGQMCNKVGDSGFFVMNGMTPSGRSDF